jgi:hypothetical protein
MVAMVEPSSLGSVSIRKGERGWRGCTLCLCVGSVTRSPYFPYMLGSACAMFVGLVVLVALTNRLRQ